MKCMVMMSLLKGLVYQSELYLCGPSPPAIVKGSEFICKLWLKSIKPVLNLVELLNSEPLSKELYLHIIHSVSTLSPCMTN